MLDTHTPSSHHRPSSGSADLGHHHSHHVWLPRGQTVAAQVPYTKRKQEWIVASVVSWNEAEMTYVVKDEFPENNKKMKSWTIPHHKVLRFPRDTRDPIMPGDRVLSLWYIPDTEEWSSMFYEATIVNSDDKVRSFFLVLSCHPSPNIFPSHD